MHFNIYFVLGKMAGKFRIAFILVIRFVPGGSLCHKTNKMACANSEVLRQSRHSENGGKIKTSTSTLSMQKKAGKSSFTFIVFVM